MPAKVTHQKARKRYTDIHGQSIEPGMMYYSFMPYGKNPIRSLVPFKRYEIEQNEDRRTLYELVDNAVESLQSCEDRDAVNSLLEDLAQDISNLVDALREKASNIEDGFGHATTLSEEFESKADDLEEYASILESGVETEELDEDELYQAALAKIEEDQGNIEDYSDDDFAELKEQCREERLQEIIEEAEEIISHNEPDI